MMVDKTFRLDDDLVVHATLALKHPGQVRPYDGLSCDVLAQDLTMGVTSGQFFKQKSSGIAKTGGKS